MSFRPAFNVNSVGVALEDSLGALEDVDSAVRPGRVAVVLKNDRAPVHRANQGGIDVAVLVRLLPPWVIGREVLLRP